MKKTIKLCFVAIVTMCSFAIVSAQSSDSMKYLEDHFPQLTELFKDEISSYRAHYIFAVDVSGSMTRKYGKSVPEALIPFFKALPDNDRVHVIPFGTEAKIDEFGFFNVINSGTRKDLCSKIPNLYTSTNHDKAFKGFTDVKKAVEGVAQVMRNNKEYKVNIVIIITDFLNDVKGKGPCKLTDADIQEMKDDIESATGDKFSRFIALALPSEQNAPGYCLDQLKDVFSVNGNSLKTVPMSNNQHTISQWFEQLRRDIMTTKLKAIVHDANRNSPVELKVDRNIDGKVAAKIHWKPSKLYPQIKIDSTYMSGDDYYFINNTENFMVTSDSPIEVELGQIKHKDWGFHNLDADMNLGLMFPVPYDDELKSLKAKKPIPSTTKEGEGLVFTFFLPFWLTATLAGLFILYIIGVFKAMARNRSLCFKANVTFFDRNGIQIGETVRIPKQSPSARMVFGKGGTGRCKVDGALWQFVVEKKKGNPLLVFSKPTFVWRKTAAYAASGKRQSGKLTDSVRVSCGDSSSNITHSVRIKLTK